jgi:hypothetical protein
MKDASPSLWELPDVLLFHIVTFLAAPTRRANVLCQIAALCKASRHAILLEEERPLWYTILKEDYGAIVAQEETNRRACKRLRRSPVHRVRDAHLLIKDNTEIAFFYLSEMTNAASKKSLTVANLRRLIGEYGPHLRINNTVSSGGLYLVEVCRARHIRESVVLKCVQELVKQRGALVNLSTCESVNSRQTALCVAAARAMPTVVKYLLQKGASRTVRCSGRFRLHTRPKKTVQCINSTPLEFCQAMRDAEKEVGACETAMRDLDNCLRLLKRK